MLSQHATLLVLLLLAMSAVAAAFVMVVRAARRSEEGREQIARAYQGALDKIKSRNTALEVVQAELAAARERIVTLQNAVLRLSGTDTDGPEITADEDD